jgi:hypothetical protein
MPFFSPSSRSLFSFTCVDLFVLIYIVLVEIISDVREGVTFINRVLPVPYQSIVYLQLTIDKQIIQLQKYTDKPQAPIILQNKILSRIFGGKVNDGVEQYTLMGGQLVFSCKYHFCFFNLIGN